MHIARRNRLLEISIAFVLVISVAAAVALGDWSGRRAVSPGEMASYHFIAYLTFPDAPPDPVYGKVVITFEGWYLAPDKTRLEFSTDALPGIKSILGTDGESLYDYNANDNRYSILSHSTSHAAPRPILFPTNYVIGPWDMSAEEFMAFKPDLRLLGEESIAGRRAVHLADSESGSGIWFDLQYEFILRLVEDGDYHFTLEVQEVEFNGDVDDSIFDFEPPEGATQTQ